MTERRRTIWSIETLHKRLERSKATTARLRHRLRRRDRRIVGLLRLEERVEDLIRQREALRGRYRRARAKAAHQETEIEALKRRITTLQVYKKLYERAQGQGIRPTSAVHLHRRPRAKTHNRRTA